MKSLTLFGTPPAPPAQPVAERRVPDRQELGITSLMSRGAILRGDVELTESMHITGGIVGNVIATKEGVALSLGVGAQIKGNIEVDTLIIDGAVMGNVRARTIHMNPGSRIDGELEYERLVVVDGAEINSTRLRRIDPAALHQGMAIQQPSATAPVQPSGVPMAPMPATARIDPAAFPNVRPFNVATG